MDLLGVLGELEPDELRIMCEDPVMKAICSYCFPHNGSRLFQQHDHHEHFDADELGLDPELDVRWLD